MNIYQIKVLDKNNDEEVKNLLLELVRKGTIEFSDAKEQQPKSSPASADQAQEIIDESEIGPYYSEKEAKDILKL